MMSNSMEGGAPCPPDRSRRGCSAAAALPPRDQLQRLYGAPCCRSAVCSVTHDSTRFCSVTRKPNMLIWWRHGTGCRKGTTLQLCSEFFLVERQDREIDYTDHKGEKT